MMKIRDVDFKVGCIPSIQTMVKIPVKNTKLFLETIEKLAKRGVQIIREAVIDLEDVEIIKNLFEKAGSKMWSPIPFVADVHARSDVALKVAPFVDKLRLNPGNITYRKIENIVKECAKNDTAIRVGVNSGSLPGDLRKIDKIEAFIKAASRYLDEIFGIDDKIKIVVSLKASDPVLNYEVNKAFREKFPNIPLHVGITEAGTSLIGSVKSAVGLAKLFAEGIGETFRISLSDTPFQELKVSKVLLSSLGLKQFPTLISCPQCSRARFNVGKVAKIVEEILEEQPDLGNFTFAVMGCPVNGPGEAQEADIGIAGGNDEVLIFKKGKVINKLKLNIEDENSLKKLILDLIQK